MIKKKDLVIFYIHLSKYMHMYLCDMLQAGFVWCVKYLDIICQCLFFKQLTVKYKNLDLNKDLLNFIGEGRGGGSF